MLSEIIQYTLWDHQYYGIISAHEVYNYVSSLEFYF